MPTETLNLVGAGGHATVVLDALLASGFPPADIAIWTEDPDGAGKDVLGCVVQFLAQPAQLSGARFHVCIGNNDVRRRLFDALIEQAGTPDSIVHPAAIISPHAELGAGSFVAARAILAPGSQIGPAAIINHGAIIDHDCHLAGYVHVAPGATLAGQVVVGQSVLVGAGANLLPCRRIGDRSVIGAGAVVVQDVPADAIYAGVPAAPIKNRRA